MLLQCVYYWSGGPQL